MIKSLQPCIITCLYAFVKCFNYGYKNISFKLNNIHCDQVIMYKEKFSDQGGDDNKIQPIKLNYCVVSWLGYKLVCTVSVKKSSILHFSVIKFGLAVASLFQQSSIILYKCSGQQEGHGMR